MASANIIVDLKYFKAKHYKYAIKKWAEYVCDPKKSDPTSIDKYDIINDYVYYSDNSEFIENDNEYFAWNYNGDINVKNDLKKQNLEEQGITWKLMISFPQQFALENGLVTKLDFYELSKHILPTFFIKAGFDVNNINWYSSLHRNTKNPHLHIIFFQKKNIVLNPFISQSCISKISSSIANYLINNQDFYITRDNEFKSLTGKITFTEFAKIKSLKFYDNYFRRNLNSKLLRLYDLLPNIGRLQYNSKNMIPYKKELDEIIYFILSHDSLKYKFAEYDILLQNHQKKLRDMYGNTIDNLNHKYYKDQLNKLFASIGNDILQNFKEYKSLTKLNKEKNFLINNITSLNFKSRNDYAKQETIIDVAKGLYKLCEFAELNQTQMKKEFNKWIHNSKYDLDADVLIANFKNISEELNLKDYFFYLKRLGYSSKRYYKYRQKNFYKEIKYKKFFKNSLDHLIYELELEEKKMVDELRYDLN